MTNITVTIYSATTKNNPLYSLALKELNPQLSHHTITPTQFVQRNQYLNYLNELKHQAFNQNTPIIFIANKGIYQLDKHLIHTHLCKGLPVKLYTPTQTIVFTTPQDFTQYNKEQAIQYYQLKQNKQYYSELLHLASQFNIPKAKLDLALIKHKDNLISQGKSTNAYLSYLGILKQYILDKYNQHHNIPDYQDTEPTSVEPEPTEPSTPDNTTLIDSNTLLQLQDLKLTQLKLAAKAANLKGYSKLNKASLINLLIPILYPETQLTTESLNYHPNL